MTRFEASKYMYEYAHYIIYRDERKYVRYSYTGLLYVSYIIWRVETGTQLRIFVASLRCEHVHIKNMLSIHTLQSVGASTHSAHGVDVWVWSSCVCVFRRERIQHIIHMQRIHTHVHAAYNRQDMLRKRDMRVCRSRRRRCCLRVWVVRTYFTTATHSYAVPREKRTLSTLSI